MFTYVSIETQSKQSYECKQTAVHYEFTEISILD